MTEQQTRDNIALIKESIERDNRPEWNIYTEVITGIVELVDSLTVERDELKADRDRLRNAYNATWKELQETSAKLQHALAPASAKKHLNPPD